MSSPRRAPLGPVRTASADASSPTTAASAASIQHEAKAHEEDDKAGVVSEDEVVELEPGEYLGVCA